LTLLVKSIGYARWLHTDCPVSATCMLQDYDSATRVGPYMIGWLIGGATLQ